MTVATFHPISKRTDLITAFTAVIDHDVFSWRGLDLEVTREGASRTVTFPDTDTDFGVLTYDDRLHTIIELIRDLEFIAEAANDEG